MFNAFYDRLQDTKREKERKLDKHHILFPRKQWETGYAKRLRDSFYMKAELPISLHHELHKQIDCVPLPPIPRIKMMYALLTEGDYYRDPNKNYTFEDRLNLLLAVWGKYEDCSLTCEALQKQKEVWLTYINHQ